MKMMLKVEPMLNWTGHTKGLTELGTNVLYNRLMILVVKC